MMKPTLHRLIPLETRVLIHRDYFPHKRESYTGRVIGIKYDDYITFTYIVLLDVPIQEEFGISNTIEIWGHELMNEDGVYEWRL